MLLLCCDDCFFFWFKTLSSLMMDTVKALRRENEELSAQVQELQSSLTTEMLSNHELSLKLQELEIQSDEKIRQLEQFIVDRDHHLNEQICELNALLAEKERELNMKNNDNNDANEEDDEEFGVYEIKFNDPTDNESTDSEQSQNRQLRQRLLKEQMDHEHLKSKHRESIAQLEDFELHSLQQQENEELRQEVQSLREKLEHERKKKDNLDKERRSSLAALSQNMFKKLLDSEHKHYDQNEELSQQCKHLKAKVEELSASKIDLITTFSKEMNTYRQTVKNLSQQNTLLLSKIQR